MIFQRMENTPAEPALGRGYLLLTRGAPWLLLLIVVGCYVMSFRARGTPDIDEYWTPWTTSIRDHGLKEGYPAARSDYPPVCFLMLGAMDHIAERWHFDHFRTLKVTLGIFAVLGGAAFWWWGRNL